MKHGRAEDHHYETPTFEVRVHPLPDSLVVEVLGELDLATGPILGQHLDGFTTPAARDGHRRTITYVLSDLEFIDAAGLNALLAPWPGAESGQVTFRHPSRQVRRLLQLVGLEYMIEDEVRQSTK